MPLYSDFSPHITTIYYLSKSVHIALCCLSHHTPSLPLPTTLPLQQQQKPQLLQQYIAITEVTTLSVDDAFLALSTYRWRSEALLNDFFADASADAFRARVGLRGGVPTPPLLTSGGGSGGAVATAFCSVGLDDFPISEMAALPCGHWFSRDAWRSALSVAMDDPHAAQLVRCLNSPGCNELVRVAFAAGLLPPSVAARRAEFNVRRFVIDSLSMTWCPGADCTFAVVTRGGEARVAEDVTCENGHAFCFLCSRPPHRPATCRDVAEWEKRESADGLTLLWMRENTKPCPKCACRVERLSGCNKVVCTRCATAMCWACGLEYYVAAGHAYPAQAWTCNRPPAVFRASASGDELTRFAHYRARFVSSAQSAQIATREIPFVTAHAEELAALVAQGGVPVPAALGVPLRVADYDFFVRGLNSVREAREYLRGTYVRAFSLRDERELALFADQQSVLEGTAERLQQLVESSAVLLLLQEVKKTRVGQEGGGAGAGASTLTAVATIDRDSSSSIPANQVVAKIVALRIEVISLISTIDIFTKNLTTMIQEGGGLNGSGVVATAAVDTADEVTFTYDDGLEDDDDDSGASGGDDQDDEILEQEEGT